MKNILKNLKTIREKKYLSQDEIAVLLNISQSQYARLEKGTTKTDLETIEKCCTVLEISLIDLITYPEKYVNAKDLQLTTTDNMEATLQIKLGKEKKDQVLKLVFGDNIIEILNK